MKITKAYRAGTKRILAKWKQMFPVLFGDEKAELELIRKINKETIEYAKQKSG